MFRDIHKKQGRSSSNSGYRIQKICGWKIYSRTRTFGAEVHKSNIRVKKLAQQVWKWWIRLKDKFCFNDLLTKSNRAEIQTYKVDERTFGTPCNSINRYGNPNATQGFIWKKNCMTALTLKRKNNNIVASFSTLFLMFPLMWITEKELGRVIENNRDEFCGEENMKIKSSHETMRNATGQQGAASKVKMSGSEK